MTSLSVLDLAPVTDGGTVAQSLANTLDLARNAERLGYSRYWLAEHHNMPGIASAATAVVIGHVAAGTSTIRVGAGGIMLPNHAPLIIAEQFGTLSALHPGRIDLGLGRAPGTDMLTAQALRRNLDASVDNFPRDVVELMAYFDPVREGQRVRAIPGEGEKVPVWILGSSLYGAQLAAMLGLPYAFASHFAPRYLHQALRIYRENFQPSAVLDKPYAMIGVPLIAAPTDEEAEFLATTAYQRVLALMRGQSLLLRPPVESMAGRWQPHEQQAVGDFLGLAVIGGPEKVRARLDVLLEQTGADELIFTCDLYQPEHRLRSFDIVAGLR